MLAYDYPLLGLFWTILWINLVIAWLIILFRVVADVFRNDDIGGFAKAMWLMVLLFLPVLGVIAYLISHGDNMAARPTASTRADEAYRANVQGTAGTPGSAVR
jgi:hypothetical protein